MYEFETRVRYSEVNTQCELKLNALANYFQDCCIFQTEDNDVGVQFLLEQNLGWVLNYWQIDIVRMPKLADHIMIGTIPYEIKGFIGFRNFYVRDVSTGEIIVTANSVWTLMNLQTGRPVKPNEKILSAYPIGPKLHMEYTDRKIVFSGDARVCEPLIVDKSMIDTNNHVNNGKYLEIALSLLPEGKVIKRLRIEYKKSAYCGDTLTPMIYEGTDSIGVSIVRADEEEPCVKCLFY